jgi:hypothetical protein
MLARKLMAGQASGGTVAGYIARAWGDTGGATAGSFTINKPSGTLQGHLMIACVFGTNNQMSADVGWSRVAEIRNDTCSGAIFEKVAGASEPSSYTFSGGGPPQKMGGEIQTWSGAQVDKDGNFYKGSGTSNIVMPGVTPSENGTLLAFVITNAASGTFSTPSGMTSRAVTNTNQPSMASFYQAVVKNVATGTRASTPTVSAAQRGVMFTLKGV